MFAFEQGEDGRVFDPVVDEYLSREEAARRHLCDGALDEHEARVIHYAEQDDRYRALGEKLLALGGLAVLLKQEPKLETLLENGSFYTGDVRQLSKNEITHEAVEELYQDGTIDEIGIGWALREDNGVWTRHAWGCDGDIVIEATEPRRSAYFGVTYDDIELSGDGMFRLNASPVPLKSQ